jgi:hypothetical protein
MKFADKTGDEITEAIKEDASGLEDISNFTRAIVRSTLKDVKGLVDNDGLEYQVVTGIDGCLTDSCLEEIMSCEELFGGVVKIGQMFLQGIPKEGHIIDPATGEPIKGIFVKKSLKAKMPS